MLLRPLPFPRAERLVTVWEREKGGTETNTGFPTFRDWAERSRSLESLGRRGLLGADAHGRRHAGAPRGPQASASFFRTLGVRPALGRDFAGQDRPVPTASSS